MVSDNRAQYKVLFFLLAVVIGATVVLSYSKGTFFQRFIGNINPLAAILISAIFCFVLLSYFLFKGWFAIYPQGILKNTGPYFGLTILFASIAILIDLAIIFPADMNIPFPESILFYPVIGFFVEILFHIIPLSALLILGTTILKNINFEKLLLVSIIIVAMLEPVFQAVSMASQPTWAILAVGVNLLFFNLTQLTIFKKFGFISMYLLRILYYLIWHIGWGLLRLDLLF